MVDLYDSVFPIFHAKNDRVRAELVGSAVVVKTESNHILVTAAHVLDHWKEGSLFTICEGLKSSIVGEVIYRPASAQDRRADMMDVGCVLLEPEFANKLDNHFVIIPESRVKKPTNSKWPLAYSVSGFPISREKRNVESVETPQWSVRGVALPTNLYAKYNCSPERNICVLFSRNNTVDLNEFEKMDVPPLNGLSGGGIYEWPPNTELLRNWTLPNLVGIFHTYKLKEEVMIGTRLDGFLSGISRFIANKAR